MPNTTDKLKQRIIELVPEIEARGASVLIEENGFDGIVNYRRDEITLEDILLAVRTRCESRKASGGIVAFENTEKTVINFLTDILL